jgi:hypothetical protein
MGRLLLELPGTANWKRLSGKCPGGGLPLIFFIIFVIECHLIPKLQSSEESRTLPATATGLSCFH